MNRYDERVGTLWIIALALFVATFLLVGVALGWF